MQIFSVCHNVNHRRWNPNIHYLVAWKTLTSFRLFFDKRYHIKDTIWNLKKLGWNLRQWHMGSKRGCSPISFLFKLLCTDVKIILCTTNLLRAPKNTCRHLMLSIYLLLNLDYYTDWRSWSFRYTYMSPYLVFPKFLVSQTTVRWTKQLYAVQLIVEKPPLFSVTCTTLRLNKGLATVPEHHNSWMQYIDVSQKTEDL